MNCPRAYRSMDIEETEKIFPEYDANKNGKITWAEYVDKMKRDVNDTTTESFKTVSRPTVKIFAMPSAS